MGIVAAFAVPHPPLIIPAVGRGEERGIPRTVEAYREVARRVVDAAPELVIVVSPHATAYCDWFHVSPGARARGDMAAFRAPGTALAVDYDAEFTALLGELARREDFPAGTAGERDAALDHGSFIPLWFIEQACAEAEAGAGAIAGAAGDAGASLPFRCVRIGLSGLGMRAHYRLGQLVAQCVRELGRRAVLVASGDLSHKLTEDGPYGFVPEGPAFDAQITEAFAAGDLVRVLGFDEAFADKAAECGLGSFRIMAGALDGRPVVPELLSYEGPFGVGYAVAAFTATDGEGDGTASDDRFRYLDELDRRERAALERRRADEDTYVRLARRSVEAYVRTHTTLSVPHDLPAEMLERRAGVFVSIHEDGALRGCIGTIEPVHASIAEEIIRNGIAACSRDPRFSPIAVDELERLVISVDVLGACEPVGGPSQLDPARYGVVVTSGERRGLLLPNLEGVDTVAEQLAIAKRKAGIREHEFCELERFEVVRHE